MDSRIEKAIVEQLQQELQHFFINPEHIGLQPQMSNHICSASCTSNPSGSVM
ncbi:hypothetical protein J2W91_001808 [Paenibacillus amylolyticus]|uniref:Uncharacterized protein n=1 Tax=Paenibacillus amylolyticus TaxID=1451 RepID=A0AAP5H1R4_PAEAM|nr:hypothetical protein [Paenibacillus amylolyticus]